MLHWLLSVVIRAGVGTVADAVKLSEGHFYPADCRTDCRTESFFHYFNKVNQIYQKL